MRDRRLEREADNAKYTIDELIREIETLEVGRQDLKEKLEALQDYIDNLKK